MKTKTEAMNLEFFAHVSPVDSYLHLHQQRTVNDNDELEADFDMMVLELELELGKFGNDMASRHGRWSGVGIEP